MSSGSTPTVDDARRMAADRLDAAWHDLSRPFGRPQRPGIWLLLLAAAALGFHAADTVACRSRGTRRAG